MPFTQCIEYKTQDLLIATVIKTSGVFFLRAEKCENSIKNNVVFVFAVEPDRGIDNLICQYYNNELRLDPKALLETWKSLKSLALNIRDGVTG